MPPKHASYMNDERASTANVQGSALPNGVHEEPANSSIGSRRIGKRGAASVVSGVVSIDTTTISSITKAEEGLHFDLQYQQEMINASSSNHMTMSTLTTDAPTSSVGSAQGTVKKFAIPAAVLQRMSGMSLNMCDDTTALTQKESASALSMNSATPSSPESAPTADASPFNEYASSGSSGGGGNDGVATSNMEEDAVAAALIGERIKKSQAAAASNNASKPLVLSRRWNRTCAASTAKQERQQGSTQKRAENNDDVESNNDGVAEEENEPSGLLSFANSGDNMIKFGRVNADNSMRSSSSSSSSQCELEEDGGDAVANGETARSGRREGGETQQQRERRLRRERQHRARVDRHMSGFDTAFVAAQEADLLAEEDEEEYSSDDDEGEDFQEEEEDYESYEDDEAEKEDEDGSATAKHGGGGGFGMFRRSENEHRHEALENTATTEVEKEECEGDPFDAAAASPSLHTRRQRFGAMFYECHVNRHADNPCHHTLLCLRGPITIQGPCGIIGFGIGEVALGGFMLGKKQVTLWSREQRAVLAPVKKIKSKASQNEELPVRELSKALAYGDASQEIINPALVREQMRLRRKSSAVHLSDKSKSKSNGDEADVDSDEEEELPLELLEDVEAVFGTIDWTWVQHSLAAWRNLFSNKMPPMVLMLQPYDPHRGVTGVRKHFLRRNESKGKQQQKRRGGRNKEAAAEEQQHHRDAYMDVPNFLARRSEQNVDLALFPDIIPAVARLGAGSVMIVGSQDIGKSTLCRFLANTLVSQHGMCYWLDLDLGQPEFGVPGQIGLYCMRRPLWMPHDESCATLVRAFFLGTTTPNCPVATAKAIASLCQLVLLVQNDHPVVINTHGWVLHTGRRVTTEVVRRLRPACVIHLAKEHEEAWAKDTAALMDTANGLNGDVVARRFLVRRSAAKMASSSNTAREATSSAAPGGSTSRKRGRAKAAEAEGGKKQQHVLLGQLPHSPLTVAQWTGTVHTVRVKREAGHGRHSQDRNHKGGAVRQARWHHQLMPLLRWYSAQSQRPSETSSSSTSTAATTLLKAPLHELKAIVLAGIDEDSGMTPGSGVSLSELAGHLEHAVVAVQFHTCKAPPPLAAAELEKQQRRNSKRTGSGTTGAVVVTALAALPNGFPISCYGYVESTEAQLRGGEIALRVPLSPSLVKEMLMEMPPSQKKAAAASSAEATANTAAVLKGISIAYGPSMRPDTFFMEQYPSARGDAEDD